MAMALKELIFLFSLAVGKYSRLNHHSVKFRAKAGVFVHYAVIVSC